MSVTETVAKELVRPILDLWINRDERRAAKDATALRFWRDGMLRQLKTIAAGKATAETFVELEKNLRETEVPVRDAMTRLDEARPHLGTGKLARLVDDVVHSDGYGKEIIRYEIRSILDNRKGEVRGQAESVCAQIEKLNAALEELHEMVYG